MKRGKDETPFLFDFGAVEDALVKDLVDGTSTSHTVPKGLTSDDSDWQEVPQPRFLSWSPMMQWAYCRDRDLDAAAFADTVDDSQFFMARAEMYQQMIKGVV